MSSKPFVIGISGPSGSGKSTLSAALADLLPRTVVVNADKYYKKELPVITSPLDGKEYPDWNHPTSIDAAGMCAELNSLCERDDIDFIIADGAFIFCIDEVRQRLDYKIFVWAEIETRIYRRICRNITLKGRRPNLLAVIILHVYATERPNIPFRPANGRTSRSIMNGILVICRRF